MNKRDTAPVGEEIDLYPFWLALHKHRRMIAILVVATMAGAAVVCQYLPKVYRVTATINLGHVESGGRIVPVVNAVDLDEILTSVGFVKKSLAAIPGMAVDPSVAKALSTDLTPNSENMQIRCDTTKPETGVKILDQLIRDLQAQYNRRAEYYRQQRDAEIFTLKESLKSLEYKRDKLKLDRQRLQQEIDQREQKLRIDLAKLDLEKKTTQDRTLRLEEQVKALTAARDKLGQFSATLEENTRQLLQQKSNLSKTSDKEGVLASILFANNIQQNISLLSLDYERNKNLGMDISRVRQDLDNQTVELKALDERIKEARLTTTTAIQDRKLSMETLTLQMDKESSAEVGKVQGQIQGLEAQKGLVEGIEIVAPPDSPTEPIRPQKSLLIAAAGGVALLVGFFLALLIERPKGLEDETVRSGKLLARTA